MSFLLFFIPVTVTLILYGIIIIYMWRKRGARNLGVSKMAKSRQVHWQITRTLLIVFLAYVACTILFATYTVMQRYGWKIKPIVKNVGLLFPYINSCMNPFVYSVNSTEFRATIAAKLRCLKSGKNQSKSKSHNGGGGGDGVATSPNLAGKSVEKNVQTVSSTKSISTVVMTTSSSSEEIENESGKRSKEGGLTTKKNSRIEDFHENESGKIEEGGLTTNMTKIYGCVGDFPHEKDLEAAAATGNASNCNSNDEALNDEDDDRCLTAAVLATNKTQDKHNVDEEGSHDNPVYEPDNEI